MKIVLSNKSFRVGSKLIYVFFLLLILISSVPMLMGETSFPFFVGYFQVVFILMVLFPTISTYLNYENLSSAIRYSLIVWSLFLLYNLSLIYNFDYYQAGRFVGLYSSPLNKGLVISLMVPFLLYFVGHEKRKLTKSLFIIAILISVILLILTASRAAGLSLLIGVFIYLYFKYKFNKMIIIISTSSLIILSSYVYLSHNVFDGFERNMFQRISSEENINLRLDDYKLSVPNNFTNFFFGAGINRGGEFLQSQGGVYRPHNFFVSFFVETGIAGLIIVILIVFFIFWRGIRRNFIYKFKKRNISLIEISLYSSGIIVLFAQQFSPYSFHRIYWLILSICFWASHNPDYFRRNSFKLEKYSYKILKK